MPEVLITIVIMGIILAIASASWQNLVQSRAVTSAANQVAADLRLAHTSATNQLATWRFVYNRNGATFACGAVAQADYCLVKLDSGGNPVQQIPRTLPDRARIRESNVGLLAGLVGSLFSGSDKRVIDFYASGSANAEGTTAPTITVGSDNGDASNNTDIQLVEATSRVRIAL